MYVSKCKIFKLDRISAKKSSLLPYSDYESPYDTLQVDYRVFVSKFTQV